MRAYLNTNIGDYKCFGFEGDIIGECGNFYVFMPDNKTRLQSYSSFKGCILLKEYFTKI